MVRAVRWFCFDLMYGADVCGKNVGVLCFFIVFVLYYQLSLLFRSKYLRGRLSLGSLLPSNIPFVSLYLQEHTDARHH